MLIPNGRKALSAYVWMKGLFRLIGDVQPNKDEVHLEAMGDSYSTHQFCFVSQIPR